MILNHVPQCTGVIVECAAAALHPNRFRCGDLHMIDELPVENRLEDGIPETKAHQVLYRVLAEVMVDTVDLFRLQVFVDTAV